MGPVFAGFLVDTQRRDYHGYIEGRRGIGPSPQRAGKTPHSLQFRRPPRGCITSNRSISRRWKLPSTPIESLTTESMRRSLLRSKKIAGNHSVPSPSRRRYPVGERTDQGRETLSNLPQRLPSSAET